MKRRRPRPDLNVLLARHLGSLPQPLPAVVRVRVEHDGDCGIWTEQRRCTCSPTIVSSTRGVFA